MLPNESLDLTHLELQIAPHPQWPETINETCASGDLYPIRAACKFDHVPIGDNHAKCRHGSAERSYLLSSLPHNQGY
jgi:hypothetical protein